MFKELLAKTARNARLLDRRKNTPQPSHHSGVLHKPTASSHRKLPESRLRARKPLKSTMVWRSPNASPRLLAASPAPLSPLAEESPVQLYPRASLRSPRHDLNAAFNKLRAWRSPQEDRPRTSYNNSPRLPQYDIRRDHNDFDSAPNYESSGSNQSVPLYRPRHLRPPGRRAWDSPLAAERRDHLQPASIAVSPTRDFQRARRCWNEAPSEGLLVHHALHAEGHFIPPRGAISSPGVRKRPGDNMIRRFGSHAAWVTDEYAKHKQQGPGYYGSP
ncbi:uncharacterized protein LOC144105569 [Amblyomma americanum]